VTYKAFMTDTRQLNVTKDRTIRLIIGVLSSGYTLTYCLNVGPLDSFWSDFSSQSRSALLTKYAVLVIAKLVCHLTVAGLRLVCRTPQEGQFFWIA